MPIAERPDEDELWERIDEAVDEADDHDDALQRLSALPKGYGLFFAFHYVDAELCNGGIRQLVRNSSWALVPFAVEACRMTGQDELAALLGEIQLLEPEAGEQPPDTHGELETRYYALDAEAEQVLEGLLDQPSLWN